MILHLTQEKWWVLITIFKEHIETKYYYGIVKSSKRSFSCHLQIDEKIYNVNTNRSKRKNWFKLCLWVFSKKKPYVVHISFYTTRSWNRSLIPYRVVLWSTPWIVFFLAPHKSSSSLRLFPFPPYDNFEKPLPLCSSTSYKYNYDKATCIVSSNLFLFTCP